MKIQSNIPLPIKLSTKEYAAQYRKKNREKIAAGSKAYYHANREQILKSQDNDKVRERKRLYKITYDHGISPEQREQMIKIQNGLCAICSKELPQGRLTHLDHCHATGKLRGMLCHKCNKGLGHFDDNSEFLRNAANYIDKHKYAEF